MTVKELIEKLEKYNMDEEVVVGIKDDFYNATEENSCDLRTVVTVDEGVLYDQQEGIIALLFNNKC